MLTSMFVHNKNEKYMTLFFNFMLKHENNIYDRAEFECLNLFFY